MIMIHIVKSELTFLKVCILNTFAYRRAAWWQWLSLWSPTEPISRQGPWYLYECGSRLHSWSWWHRSKPRKCWWLGYLWADEEHGIITLYIYIYKKWGDNSHLSLVDTESPCKTRIRMHLFCEVNTMFADALATQDPKVSADMFFLPRYPGITGDCP